MKIYTFNLTNNTTHKYALNGAIIWFLTIKELVMYFYHNKLFKYIEDFDLQIGKISKFDSKIFHYERPFNNEEIAEYNKYKNLI